MEKNIYVCDKDKVEIIEDFDSLIVDKNRSKIYLIDIVSSDRNEVIPDLKKYGIPDNICNKLLTPVESTRFKHIEGVLYGEIAYFSPKTKTSNYASIIIHNNILIIIHPIKEGVISNYITSLPSLTKKIEGEFIPEFIIYGLILEMLSDYSKLIMHYRENIETLAHNLDKRNMDLSINDISKSKFQLSTLEIVLEKLYFTLSFPPSKNMMNLNSPYSDTFNYLIKNVSVLKSYVDQNQDRLDSLNDHYQLILHDRANKRLNFLTVTQAIFVPLTLVVGVYGMNFSYMPELDFKYGYFITLGVMAFVASMFLVYFKKHGWFN